MRQNFSVRLGQILTLIVSFAMTSSPALSLADNGQEDGRPQPYPNLRYFSQIDAAPYMLSESPGVTLPDQPGYWFVTAQGLDCGIWFRGSFGCAGDIPGMQPGIHEIGWITGDTRVHYDWTLAARFPATRGSVSIPALTYISVGGTKCGTTLDGSTYCEHGPYRMLIAQTHAWLNG